MKAILLIFLAVLVRGHAHEEPVSYVDLVPEHDSVRVEILASATDFSHYLPGVDTAMLLRQDTLDLQKPALTSLIRERLRLEGLELEPVHAVPVVEKEDVRLTFHAPWEEARRSIRVNCLLFPYDPRHRTFVTVKRGGVVEATQVFDSATPSAVLPLGQSLSVPGVMADFFHQGLHHIFIGPDHILFVVGLMLLGGGVRKLLSIITAFTAAHSITLCLATLQILTPPARIIEPVIALSIVLVGIHAMMPGQRRDPRLVFAFLFGLIHGFGFAFALSGLELPGAAFGWSLAAFNVGVEAGQAVIILATVPLLQMVRRYSEKAGERLVTACAACVIAAGTFWFMDRLIA